MTPTPCHAELAEASASPMVQWVKESACNAGAVGSILGSGGSPGGGNGNPPQHSFLKNPMDRGAWQATVQKVTKNWTQLSMHDRTGRPPSGTCGFEEKCRQHSGQWIPRELLLRTSPGARGLIPKGQRRGCQWPKPLCLLGRSRGRLGFSLGWEAPSCQGSAR